MTRRNWYRRKRSFAIALGCQEFRAGHSKFLFAIDGMQASKKIWARHRWRSYRHQLRNYAFASGYCDFLPLCQESLEIRKSITEIAYTCPSHVTHFSITIDCDPNAFANIVGNEFPLCPLNQLRLTARLSRAALPSRRPSAMPARLQADACANLMRVADPNG